MAKQRVINTRFWVDNYTANLDPVEKLLFLYFLTNPATEICGIYQLPLRNVAVDTGIDKEMVEKILARFSRDDKVYYIDGWVCVVNFAKHQAQNPSVKKGIERCMDEVPEEIHQKLAEVCTACHRLSQAGTLNLTKPNLTKPIRVATKATKYRYEPQDIEMAQELLALIQQNTPTFKQPNIEMWADHVRLMRERDGRTQEQIRYLIHWTQGNDFWCANILSTKKLREKFDTLVAQAKRVQGAKIVSI